MVLSSAASGGAAGRVWAVGALCHAVADALDARFNPVAVRGEISGFSRAASGHCYFSIKDAGGQIRCAMFRRAASLLDFAPRDGELVEVRGRLGVYEARGDLQLVAEWMGRVGQGGLFEQFLQRKARLEAEGLFDAGRKRPLPAMPRAVGIVTSLGAAALHDVVTALRRRAPHLLVVLAPAAVQGAGAPAELVAALGRLQALADDPAEGVPLDLILLVRGGGSIEDLWAFNDEGLARAIAASRLPVVTGVGHETDFTIADFVSDLRAPTPTAAAELAAPAREALVAALDLAADALEAVVQRRIDRWGQRLDGLASRLGRPSSLVGRQRLLLDRQAQALRYGVRERLQRATAAQERAAAALPQAVGQRIARLQQRTDRVALRLELLDPGLVLQRGYAWIEDADGNTVQRAAQTRPGQALRATFADGTVPVTVQPHD
ncbi:exodeoxyribonuclease VII large subunit [uncultured Xylophilus sp.]|uniref:exodeoxyribonuclease VII large subunit n=1 Tax=uncultured Xylophilus sp. TaxID=296832 RepID=UPI0025E2D2E9|nr:exodeoxyribonuclease VII large subunit [uncultured Xylophilus sp.]